MPRVWHEKHGGPPQFQALRGPYRLSLSAADFPLTPPSPPQSEGEGHYGGLCTHGKPGRTSFFTQDSGLHLLDILLDFQKLYHDNCAPCCYQKKGLYPTLVQDNFSRKRSWTASDGSFRHRPGIYWPWEAPAAAIEHAAASHCRTRRAPWRLGQHLAGQGTSNFSPDTST